MHRFLVTGGAAAAILLAVPVPVPAESLLPREPGPAATVRIAPATLEPGEARLAEGRTVRIANESTAMARLEFDLGRGEGIPCAPPGGAVVRARRFVVADGDALHCAPPPGRLDFRVQRAVRTDGGFEHRVDEGSLDVE